MEKKLMIKQSWCKGCGFCVAFCPKNVLELKKDKICIRDEAACIYCGQCELRCPDFAIYVEEKEAEATNEN